MEYETWKRAVHFSYIFDVNVSTTFCEQPATMLWRFVASATAPAPRCQPAPPRGVARGRTGGWQHRPPVRNTLSALSYLPARLRRRSRNCASIAVPLQPLLALDCCACCIGVFRHRLFRLGTGSAYRSVARCSAEAHWPLHQPLPSSPLNTTLPPQSSCFLSPPPRLPLLHLQLLRLSHHGAADGLTTSACTLAHQGRE